MLKVVKMDSMQVLIVRGVMQYCMIWAVTMISPTRVTVIRTMQIVIAYGVQVVVFGNLPNLTDLLGAALVLSTVLAITFEKQLTSSSCDPRNLCCVVAEPLDDEY